MAYFPNGTAGEVFDEQCCRCKHGQKFCPVYFVQSTFNYDAINNEVATKILNYLVKGNGRCEVFEMAKHDFEIDINQIEMDL